MSMSRLTARSVGTGHSILAYVAKPRWLDFKSLVAGSGVTITEGAKTLTIASTGGGSSGITRSVSNISTTTAAGSTALTDYVYFCTGTFTLTLPTAVGNTNRYSIQNAGSGTVTIAGTINGGTNFTLAPASGQTMQSIDLVSNNTSWGIF